MSPARESLSSAIPSVPRRTLRQRRVTDVGDFLRWLARRLLLRKGPSGTADFVSFAATAASGAEPPEALWRGAFGDSVVDMLLAEEILPALLAKQATAEQLARAEEIVLAAGEWRGEGGNRPVQQLDQPYPVSFSVEPCRLPFRQSSPL